MEPMSCICGYFVPQSCRCKNEFFCFPFFNWNSFVFFLKVAIFSSKVDRTLFINDYFFTVFSNLFLTAHFFLVLIWYCLWIYWCYWYLKIGWSLKFHVCSEPMSFDFYLTLTMDIHWKRKLNKHQHQTGASAIK